MKIINKIIYLLQIIVICLFLFACDNDFSVDYQNTQIEKVDTNELEFTFRAEYLRMEHFEKHKKEFDYKTAKEYELGANRVIKSKDALIKEEKEDGDYVYYIEDTNEIVFLSKDGYIRSYFKPSKGKKYFDSQ